MRFLKYFLYILPTLLFIVYITVRDVKGSLGTRKNPVKLYFTPSVDAEKITLSAKPLIQFLERETGYYFETAIPTSYIAVVEAFGTDRADIAIINSFSYLLAHQKYGANAVLRVIRTGNQAYYRGQIIVRTDSGIDRLEDLNGKSIAYVDASSASGYILPSNLLKKQRIKPSRETFAMKHDNVVIMVYQKQVDAGATFYSPPHPVTGEPLDARSRVKKQYPDVFEKIKILALTDSLPNDPVVFRKGMPPVMVERIKNALLKFANSEEGKKIMPEIYSMEGLIETSDSDYDLLRKLIKETGLNLEEMVK
ncbi:MAG: phosphate/phosphite/phosphonate ABC transporter substrate-binding protein [Ignavibacteria bacterium]